MKVKNKNDFIPDLYSGCKFQGLVSLLEKTIPQDQKVVVFSQFVSVLQICSFVIKQSPLLCSREVLTVSGETSQLQRSNVFEEFAGVCCDEKYTSAILLLLVQVGGVGLNFTACHYAIFMDPSFNPQVERQAADRLHRIGQIFPVYIYKLYVRKTIEELILNMQANKLRIAEDVYSRTYFEIGSHLQDGYMQSHDRVNVTDVMSLYSQVCEAFPYDESMPSVFDFIDLTQPTLQVPMVNTT